MHSDYACRVLMYLAIKPGERVSIQEIAEAFSISENHLVKVVHRLGKLGFVATTRGRHGGIELGRDPASISIGDVVRQMEPNFNIVECFEPGGSRCAITSMCLLKGALAKARDAFFAAIDPVTLADITANRALLSRTLRPSALGD